MDASLRPTFLVPDGNEVTDFLQVPHRYTQPHTKPRIVSVARGALDIAGKGIGGRERAPGRGRGQETPASETVHDGGPLKRDEAY